MTVSCIRETRFQESRYVIGLTSSFSPSLSVCLPLSRNTEAAVSDVVGVGVASSKRAEAALIDWIPVDSRLSAAILAVSYRVYNCHSDRRPSLPSHIRSPDAITDTLNQKLRDLLRTASWGYILIMVGNMNARILRLSSNEGNLCGFTGPDSIRSENG